MQRQKCDLNRVHTHNIHTQYTIHMLSTHSTRNNSLDTYAMRSDYIDSQKKKNTMQSKYKVFEDIATDGTANQIHTICTTDI